MENPPKRKRPVLWIVLISVFVLMLVTSAFFLMASAVPGDYQPFMLTKQERTICATDMVNKHLLGKDGFINKFGTVGPFEYTLTQDELNYYLASLDEIAYLRPGAMKTGGVYEAMDKAGMAEPFIAMKDGLLTIMFRVKSINKIISMDLSFDVNDDDLMVIRNEQIRVGRMPVPEMIVRGSLETLKTQMQDKLSQLTAKNLEDNPVDMDLLLAIIIANIDEKPFSSELKIGKQTKRTHRVELTDGAVKLHIVPVDKD